MRMVKFSREALGGLMVGEVTVFMIYEVCSFNMNDCSCRLYVIN